MKKYVSIVLAVAITLVLSASAFAVGPGKKLEFEGGPMGKVVFTGDTHKVNKCNECHPDPFKMKKGSVKITQADHTAGKFCGKCHDGSKSFSWAKDAGNCGKCHKK